jgi:NAD(P)-dependent dehydrogenase (short-subunit alcohol dehydrogenase family)
MSAQNIFDKAWGGIFVTESFIPLDGKVAVVTGAGGGIGRDIALQLAKAGAAVVVNDIGASLTGEGKSAGPAEQVCQEITAAGGKAVPAIASVADPLEAQSIVDTALQAFGRIDYIVNNAGILRDVLFHKMSINDFESVVKVHLFGSFYLSRAAATHFREQGSGAFLHMTSTSGLIGNLGQANYSAAKLGMVGLSRSIAIDMARFGVRSNCIAPFAWSRMTSSIPAETPDQKQRVERLKQMTSAKIAPLAVFLGSDSAKGVTAQIFAVRSNEIFLMSQSRPLRSVHRGEGWTPEAIAAHGMPALAKNFVPLDLSADVFNWDPV